MQKSVEPPILRNMLTAPSLDLGIFADLKYVLG